MVGLQQQALQAMLLGGILLPRPGQQSVCIKSVPDPASPIRIEGEPHIGAALGDMGTRLGLLFSAGAVFFAQIFSDITAFGHHIRMEFKGSENAPQLQSPAPHAPAPAPGKASPTAHHGQATSDTKSIFRVFFMRRC